MERLQTSGGAESRVIVNADDFGLNEHISRAIVQAFAERRVTDTTMMATGKYFDEAVKLAKENGFFGSIGIHLNLTEGEPLTEDIKCEPRFVTDGRFNKRYRRAAPLSPSEKRAVYKELTAQVRRLKDAHIRITHADSHHHIHTAPWMMPIAVRVCRENGIDKIRIPRNLRRLTLPQRLETQRCIRYLRRRGMITTDSFAYVMDIREIAVPDNTEILVHPDYDKNGVLIDRRGVRDGYPTGYALPDIAKEKQVTLKSYTALPFTT